MLFVLCLLSVWILRLACLVLFYGLINNVVYCFLLVWFCCAGCLLFDYYLSCFGWFAGLVVLMIWLLVLNLLFVLLVLIAFW